MYKKFSLTLTLSVLLVGLSGFAQANVIGNIVADGRIHGLQDTSADIGVAFNAMTGTYQVSTGALGTGSFLAAGIGFDTLERLGFPDVTLTGANGFSILKIRSVVAAGVNGQGVPLSSFVFDAPTVTEWNDIVDDLFGGNTSLYKTQAGTLVNLYENASQNFDRIGGTLTSSGATLTTGASKIAELGFTGPVVGGNVTDNAIGEGWEATGPTTPGLGALTPLNAGILGTSFAFALNLLDGFPGFTFLPLLSGFDGGIGAGASAQFVGGGTLSGYGDGTGSPVGPWQIGNDADFSFRPYVPEPSSIAIFAGLAACVMAGRRRRS